MERIMRTAIGLVVGFGIVALCTIAAFRLAIGYAAAWFVDGMKPKRDQG